MSSWNYRILKHEVGRDVTYRLHSVYYDHLTEPCACSLDPATVESEEGAEGIKSELQRMLEAVDKPILNYNDLTGEVV